MRSRPRPTPLLTREQRADINRGNYRAYLADPWTPEQVARLRSLVEFGVAFKEIGRIMGMTKDKAIGKAYRLKLRGPRSKAPAAVAPTLVEWLDTLDTFPPRGGCVYPLGDPGRPGFHFCADPIADGRPSYCVAHDKVTHVAEREAKHELAG